MTGGDYVDVGVGVVLSAFYNVELVAVYKHLHDHVVRNYT